MKIKLIVKSIGACGGVVEYFPESESGGLGNSRFRAYNNITAEQDAAEIEKNLGRPTSDFLLSGEDSLEEQELKLSFIIVWRRFRGFG